MLTPKLP
jgi:hypothetical protein